jgi:hypothetical protein
MYVEDNPGGGAVFGRPASPSKIWKSTNAVCGGREEEANEKK